MCAALILVLGGELVTGDNWNHYFFQSRCELLIYKEVDHATVIVRALYMT